MSTQSSLNLSAKKSGPVECLGQSFPSDDARREHYLNLLTEKLKDPEFRKIDGFPIGEDEDILALSDPPYYTACPNPWIGDFIQHYGRPYDLQDKYHREPFVADVKEGKNHPIYNAHSYHTKVPHRAIMRYILHYTEPGDIVFDGFCGTGMTGVAAQLCGDLSEVQALGYRVDGSNNVHDESGKAFSKLGARISILNDISPVATFISRNYNEYIDPDKFEVAATQIVREVEEEFGDLFITTHSDGKTKCPIKLTIWSDCLICPECGSDFVFWDEAANAQEGSLVEPFPCPGCGTSLSKKNCQCKKEIVFDHLNKRTVERDKKLPVAVIYTHNGKRIQKPISEIDIKYIQQSEERVGRYWIPISRMMQGGETRRNDPSGFMYVHHFYTNRNLLALSAFREKIFKKFRDLPALGLWFTSSHPWTTRLARLLVTNYFKKTGGVVAPTLQGTLYMSSVMAETNAIDRFSLRISSVPYTAGLIRPIVSTGSTSQMRIPDNSIDYLFLDPPFGANIAYSELNYLWESWLGVCTNIDDEAIENKPHKKSLGDYQNKMRDCFSECYRVLKPGRWMTVEFSNTKASVWNSIQSALGEVGFVVANVSILEKTHKGFRAVTTTTAVKEDLAITAYKPGGELAERFRKRGHTVEGIWDFMRTHLRNLPVIKPRGGELEFIAERDPRILYDRMVAFYVGHGVPVPLSSAEFQAALVEKFPEREGMFFLPEHVAEWDKKRAQMEGVGQMSIFVEDERSAIDWLRNQLKTRPSTYQDFAQEFMQQLNASWKKFESRPELSLLLDQNFLKYDGHGEVPSQIHSYLSTQFKDLRNLPKDSAQLQAKAKDRWYVPDPAKAIDREEVRNKQLRKEFWDLCTEAGIARPSGPTAQRTLPLLTPTSAKKTGRKKLKEVRTEAVRLGFKECFAAKDYATILAIAGHLPANVIEEDEQLQMMHDMAEMRAQG
jgi:DNA modification methylase